LVERGPYINTLLITLTANNIWKYGTALHFFQEENQDIILKVPEDVEGGTTKRYEAMLLGIGVNLLDGVETKSRSRISSMMSRQNLAGVESPR